jgi:hypothetical protein
MATTLDGSPVFGDAVNVAMTPNANAQQLNEFFGLNGQQTLFGGSRGRTFMISGVLSAPDVGTLNDVEAALLAFADGLPHVLVDNRGRVFQNVVFKGEYQPNPGLLFAQGAVGLAYKLTMIGLT